MAPPRRCWCDAKALNPASLPSGALLGIAFAALTACGRETTPERVLPHDAPAYVIAGHYADSIVALARSDAPGLSDEAIVAVGYLEQLRLGLGSPFRLVERATDDARLPTEVRERVARALIGRIGRGESYAAASGVEDAIFSAGGARSAEPPAVDEHAIGRTVQAASDPWAGELAVRLAYAVAAASGSSKQATMMDAAESAFLWRDRDLAALDVARLLRVAADGDVSAISLVPRWRAVRGLAVEAPPLARSPAASDSAAVVVALAFADGLSGMGAIRRSSEPSDIARPVVGPKTAMRWATLARARRAPPHAAVVVELRTLRAQVLGPADRGRQARAALLREAIDEESLAARHAIAWWAGGPQPGLARAMRRVAVALRAYAQEPVEAPNLPTGVVESIRRSHGLAALSFDATVPAAWRPHYASALDRALTDTRRVLPRFNVRGLRVRFGRTPVGDVALAVHEPTRRTLFLPPTTASGTLAHELAHDLDWSAMKSGTYSTDQSIRRGVERLAAVLARMTADSLVSPGPENRYHVEAANRPAEVFARAFDWFIATSLAGEGPGSNGHLSGVQDELFVGRAGAVAPGRRGVAAYALVDVLDEMTTVPAAASGAYLSRHGAARPLTAWESVRALLDVTAPTPDEIERVRAASTSAFALGWPDERALRLRMVRRVRAGESGGFGTMGLDGDAQSGDGARARDRCAVGGRASPA